MVVYPDASALHCTKLAVRKSISPVRGGRSSPVLSPTTGPGSLLCSEFNESLNGRASAYPSVMMESFNEEKTWMDKVIGIFQATDRDHNGAALQACNGKPLVQPPLPSRPLTATSDCRPTSSPKYDNAAISNPRRRSSSPQSPCSLRKAPDQELHDSKTSLSRMDACSLYPVPLLDSRPSDSAEADIRVVLDERSCRAGCGTDDFVSTGELIGQRI
jgi:hypothetical protein